MKLLNLSIFSLALIFSSCGNSSKTEEKSTDSNTKTTESKLPTGDNSKTSLDWSGTYKGILPCADCEGIETIIKLNEDFSYSKKVKYLGKDNSFQISKGKFSWDDNGNLIYLDKDKPNAYRVGENQLFALDMNDERITGDLQERYILKKLNEEDLILESYWKLVSLNGKTLQEIKNKANEAHIMFIKQDTMVVGSGGCNRLRGSFSLESSTNHLSFKQISTTLMACDNLDTETSFLSILEKVNQYQMVKDTLKIFNDDKSNSATFVKSESPE